MREAKEGHIINISSDADRKVFPGSSIYSATKAAVTLLSRGLKLELCQEGLPINVTSLSPGATKTELGTHITDKDVIQGFKPGFEFMDSGELAEVILFVLTRPSSINIDNISLRPVGQPE